MTAPVDAVLARLEAVKKSADGWTARCPAHEDRSPSLGVAIGRDGRVLLHCYAGCEPDAVARALGLELRDLFPGDTRPVSAPAAAAIPPGITPASKRERGRLGPIAAAYPYTDEAGAVLFRVTRHDPKDFRQSSPDGRGGWTMGRKGARVVPYRLPRVLEAVQAGRFVFVVEGEKDADRLEALGFVATCNAGGAGKWGAEHAAFLEGARVVILPDQDEPGRAHAEAVARTLDGTAAEVRVLELPGLAPKGDVSDWLAAGRTADELRELVRAAPLWTAAAADALAPRARALCMADVEPEDVRYLWEPYIPLRKLTFLEGDPGEGKTWVSLALAAAVSRGDPMPGEVPAMRRDPARVLYWSAEDGLADTLRPRLDAAGADVRNVFALVPADDTRDFLTLADTAHIEAVLEENRPRLLVIDPVQAALGAEVDAHRANEVRPRLSLLKAWAERFDMAVLVIRHLSKAPTSKAIHRGLGSIDFSAAARSVLLLGKLPDDEARRAVVQVKNSVGPHGAALEFTIEDGALRWHTGPSTVTAATLFAPERSDEDRSALEEAVAFLKDALADMDRPVADVEKEARSAGIAERTLRRAREQLGVKARKDGTVWKWPKLTTKNLGHVGQDAETQALQGNNHVGQVGQVEAWTGSTGELEPVPAEEEVRL